MNFLQSWILIKVLMILFFFSGLFGTIRFFVHPDMSKVALVISLTAFFSGMFMLGFIFREERRLSSKVQASGHKLLGPVAGCR